MSSAPAPRSRKGKRSLEQQLRVEADLPPTDSNAGATTHVSAVAADSGPGASSSSTTTTTTTPAVPPLAAAAVADAAASSPYTSPGRSGALTDGVASSGVRRDASSVGRTPGSGTSPRSTTLRSPGGRRRTRSLHDDLPPVVPTPTPERRRSDCGPKLSGIYQDFTTDDLDYTIRSPPSAGSRRRLPPPFPRTASGRSDGGAVVTPAASGGGAAFPRPGSAIYGDWGSDMSEGGDESAAPEAAPVGRASVTPADSLPPTARGASAQHQGTSASDTRADTASESDATVGDTGASQHTGSDVPTSPSVSSASSAGSEAEAVEAPRAQGVGASPPTTQATTASPSGVDDGRPTTDTDSCDVGAAPPTSAGRHDTSNGTGSASDADDTTPHRGGNATSAPTATASGCAPPESTRAAPGVDTSAPVAGAPKVPSTPASLLPTASDTDGGETDHGTASPSASVVAPTKEEVHQFAKYLGMDPAADADLLWIAQQAMTAPLPDGWRVADAANGSQYFWHVSSPSATTWAHPRDGYYKDLYKQLKQRPPSTELVGAPGAPAAAGAPQTTPERSAGGESKDEGSRRVSPANKGEPVLVAAGVLGADHVVEDTTWRESPFDDAESKGHSTTPFDDATLAEEAAAAEVAEVEPQPAACGTNTAAPPSPAQPVTTAVGPTKHTATSPLAPADAGTASSVPVGSVTPPADDKAAATPASKSRFNPLRWVATKLSASKGSPPLLPVAVPSPAPLPSAASPSDLAGRANSALQDQWTFHWQLALSQRADKRASTPLDTASSSSTSPARGVGAHSVSPPLWLEGEGRPCRLLVARLSTDGGGDTGYPTHIHPSDVASMCAYFGADATTVAQRRMAWAAKLAVAPALREGGTEFAVLVDGDVWFRVGGGPGLSKAHPFDAFVRRLVCATDLDLAPATLLAGGDALSRRSRALRAAASTRGAGHRHGTRTARDMPCTVTFYTATGTIMAHDFAPHEAAATGSGRHQRGCTPPVGSCSSLSKDSDLEGPSSPAAARRVASECEASDEATDGDAITPAHARARQRALLRRQHRRASSGSVPRPTSDLVDVGDVAVSDDGDGDATTQRPPVRSARRSRHGSLNSTGSAGGAGGGAAPAVATSPPAAGAGDAAAHKPPTHRAPHNPCQPFPGINDALCDEFARCCGVEAAGSGSAAVPFVDAASLSLLTPDDLTDVEAFLSAVVAHQSARLVRMLEEREALRDSLDEQRVQVEACIRQQLAAKAPKGSRPKGKRRGLAALFRR